MPPSFMSREPVLTFRKDFRFSKIVSQSRHLVGAEHIAERHVPLPFPAKRHGMSTGSPYETRRAERP